MNQSSRPADRQAIAQLNSDFGYELDRGTVDGFAALFTADALYTHGARVLRGEADIREFYMSRTRSGPRTSRHFATGLRIDFTGEARARGWSTCMTFSAPGVPPIKSTIPAIVADFEDLYTFDGTRWRFSERHIMPMFRVATPA